MTRRSTTDNPRIALPSDHSLLRRVRAGQSDAATDLYERYADRLWGLASRQIGKRLAQRVEPDDVVQSVFRTFFRRVVDGQYEIPKGEEIWGLFLVIALNKVRAMAVHQTAAKRDVDRTESLEGGHHHLPARDNGDLLRMVISDLVSQLSPSQQQIVTLRVEGHTAHEIATAVGCSKRTVERVLQQFRAKLSTEIERDN